MQKNIIRFCFFSAIMISFFYITYNVYCFKYGDGIYSLKKFYELEKNQIDVLVLGSSHAYEDINPAVLWDEHGIAAYDLCGSIQPLWNTYYYLKEALKTQTPRLIILEAYTTTFADEYSNDSRIIKNTYGLKPSLDKIKAIGTSSPVERQKEFLLEFTQYHTRYKELTMADFVKGQGNNLYEDWKGFGCNMETVGFAKPNVRGVTEIGEMSEKTEEYYVKVLRLANENGIPVLVIVSPYADITIADQCIYNRAAVIAEEEGALFYNFNSDYDEIGLDFTTDMADGSHLNYIGNQKFTRYLGKFLDGNYDDLLIDRRGDAAYASWERNSEYFQQQLYNQRVKNCTSGIELIKLLHNDNYISVVSMKGVNLSKEIWEEGLSLSEIEDDHLENSVWILESNRIMERLKPADKEYYHMELAAFSDLVVRLGGNAEGGNQIIYNRLDYSKAPNGVNIFIYDKKTGSVVDSVWLDIENNLGCVR